MLSTPCYIYHWRESRAAARPGVDAVATRPPQVQPPLSRVMKQLLVVTLFCCAQHGASRRARRSLYDEFKDAVIKGHALTAQRLLDQGANPNHYDKYFHPLTEAALQNRPSMIDILLRGGAEVDGRSDVNATALHVASEAGFTNLVQRLLDAGAGVDEMTTMSERTNVTALHLAARRGHVAWSSFC